MSQIVIYCLHSTSILSFHIDVVLTFCIEKLVVITYPCLRYLLLVVKSSYITPWQYAFINKYKYICIYISVHAVIQIYKQIHKSVSIYCCYLASIHQYFHWYGALMWYMIDKSLWYELIMISRIVALDPEPGQLTKRLIDHQNWTRGCRNTPILRNAWRWGSSWI